MAEQELGSRTLAHNHNQIPCNALGNTEAFPAAIPSYLALVTQELQTGQHCWTLLASCPEAHQREHSASSKHWPALSKTQPLPAWLLLLVLLQAECFYELSIMAKAILVLK